VGREVWDLLSAADLCSKGLPPIAGGSLDQTKWFVDAARFAWAEDQYWKLKLSAGPK
jgi:hypothetical protein